MIRRVSCMLAIGLFLVVAATLSAKTDPKDPPPGKFADQWYAVMLQGKKCGYMHSTMTRRGDEIRTYAKTLMKVGRGRQAVTMSVTLNSRERLDGTPLAFESDVDASLTRMTYKGVIRDGKVTVTSTQLGQQQRRTYDLPADARLSWGAYLETIRHGFKPGTNYRLNLYDPTTSPDSTIAADVKVIKREMIDLFGRKVEATKMEHSMALASALGTINLTMTTWVDEKGEALLTKTQIIQIPVEMIQCAKAYALEEADPPELFLNTLISADRSIDRDAAKRVVFRLSLSGDGEMPDLPITGMQKPARSSQGSLTLTVARQDHHALKAAKPKPIPSAVREYLEPSAYLNYDDPAVAKLARQAVPEEKDPYLVADGLRKLVTKYVNQKTLNVGFATASEVARSREGDCSEHAVLLSALARSRGLPSRVVGGLVYCDRVAEKKNVFGYHMWTQVYLGAQWVDLDAAQGQTNCDPTHIALSVSALADKGLPDVALSLLTVIKRLRIETVEVEQDSARRPAEPLPAAKSPSRTAPAPR